MMYVCPLIVKNSLAQNLLGVCNVKLLKLVFDKDQMIYRARSNLFVTAYNTELPDHTHFFITLVMLYVDIFSFENTVTLFCMLPVGPL